jgi:hypothetical protein
MYWTLQNLKDSENKQLILPVDSIYSAATVICYLLPLSVLFCNVLCVAMQPSCDGEMCLVWQQPYHCRCKVLGDRALSVKGKYVHMYGWQKDIPKMHICYRHTQNPHTQNPHDFLWRCSAQFRLH